VLIWDSLQKDIAIHANHSGNCGLTVIVPDDGHDNDVDDILSNCTAEERQRYNELIANYKSAEIGANKRPTLRDTDVPAQQQDAETETDV
jgi:hypothetical protein